MIDLEGLSPDDVRFLRRSWEDYTSEQRRQCFLYWQSLGQQPPSWAMPRADPQAAALVPSEPDPAPAPSRQRPAVAVSGRKPVVLIMRGSPAWRRWTRRAAAHAGLPLAILVDQALRRHVITHGFTEPAPLR
jgi:hypothetical protein